MNDSIYRVSLDIHDTSSQVMLNVKKGDSKRKILITLTDGGKPYAIASDCSAVFRAKKPDDTVLYNDCTISNNVITYSLTNQTSASVGVVECEVTLYGGDNSQITSPRFALCVEDSICSDSEIESTNEFTALAQTISQANNINATVSKVGDTATISITKKDGTVVSASVSDGENGTDGISVTGVTINSIGHLILTLSSGATIDAGMVKGTPGDAGYSPTATVSKSGSVATITIKDKNGTTTATVSDGSKGEPGDDGVSPTVSVSAISGGHRITITDATGSRSFDVMDGNSHTHSNKAVLDTITGSETWTFTLSDGTTVTKKVVTA